MRNFFRGVRKRIGKLDAGLLREQYELIADEADFLETLFATNSEGIIVLDDQGSAIKSNPAAKALLGMEPEDAVNDLAVPLGKASKKELAITYPDEKILEMRTLPLKSGGTLVYLRDMTAERKRSEEELRLGATKAVRDLASGVAHEIANPLNAISLNLQLLEREIPDNESIKTCRKQILRLESILREFLQALRPSRPNLAPGSIADPLKNCLATLRNEIEERCISVTLDIPSALPSVAIDKSQFEQVYFNIIKNALEATKCGGHLWVEVTSDDNDAIVRIKDDGEGIAPEQLIHLFEPYRTTKEKGNGLGLMISARIIRDHGGTICAESKQACGTTFTIRIPRLEKRIRRLKG